MAQQATQLKQAPPQVPPQQDQVEIHHWDGESYDTSAPDNRFIGSLDDQRQSNGQVFQSIRAVDVPEDRDLQLNVITEINTLHGDTRPLPCVHVAIEDCDGTVSIFRSPEGLLLRLETDVRLSRARLPDGSLGYLISSD